MNSTDSTLPELTIQSQQTELPPPVLWPSLTSISEIKTQDSTAWVDSDRIAANFGQSTATYHAQAHLQRDCAQRLLHLLDDSLLQDSLPSGPLLEMGCGTGFITELLFDRLASPQPLSKQLQGRDYYITDLSEAMVLFCRDRLQPKIKAITSNPGLNHQHQRTQFFFHPCNAEMLPAKPSFYSLIVGGFVVQWFQQIEHTLQRLLDRLQLGGRLLLSFPGHESFPEWRQQCRRLNLPFTAHPLPNPALLLQRLERSPNSYQVQVQTEWYPTYYDNAAAFFHSLKAIGAGMGRANVQLTSPQLRQLLRQWQPANQNPSLGSSSKKQVKVQYQIIYLLITRLK
ncbi:MAG: methyltransferase [Leptolyngbyaceae cyanobacterium]